MPQLRLAPSGQSQVSPLARQLFNQGATGGPIRTPLEGLGKLSSTVLGHITQRRHAEAARAARASQTAALLAGLGLPSPEPGGPMQPDVGISEAGATGMSPNITRAAAGADTLLGGVGVAPQIGQDQQRLAEMIRVGGPEAMNSPMAQALVGRIMQGPQERRIIQDADGFQRFADTRERVFPDAKGKQENLPESIQVLNALNIPLDSPEAREIALRDLTPETKQPELLQLMEAMNLDPGTPEGRDFIIATKTKPVASVTLPSDERESEFEKGTGKKVADVRQEIIDGAKNARERQTTIGLLNNLSEQIDQGGALAPARFQVARVMKSLGIDPEIVGVPEDKVGLIEVMNKMTGRLALGNLEAFTGAISEGERKFAVELEPGLSTTVEGRKVLLEIQTKVAGRASEAAQFTDQWERRFGGLDKPNEAGQRFQFALADHFASRPLFDDDFVSRATTTAGATADPLADIPEADRLSAIQAEKARRAQNQQQAAPVPQQAQGDFIPVPRAQ